MALGQNSRKKKPGKPFIYPKLQGKSVGFPRGFFLEFFPMTWEAPGLEKKKRSRMRSEEEGDYGGFLGGSKKKPLLTHFLGSKQEGTKHFLGHY